MIGIPLRRGKYSYNPKKKYYKSLLLFYPPLRRNYAVGKLDFCENAFCKSFNKKEQLCKLLYNFDILDYSKE